MNEQQFEQLINIINEEEKYVKNEVEEAKKSLEPYRIKNAIIYAAGQGSRMRPLTDNTPKPLLKVNGKPMIEYVIDSLQEIQIESIFIVVGFQKDQFLYLQSKYNNITFIVNGEYESKNNISSLYAAREAIKKENCYITEADFIIPQKGLFRKYIYYSQYMGQKTEIPSGWGFKMQGDRIASIVKEHPDIELVGITCWLKEDAIKLGRAVEALYNEENGTMWWDEVVHTILNDVNVHVQLIDERDVIELDTVEELSAVDSSYSLTKNSKWHDILGGGSRRKSRNETEELDKKSIFLNLKGLNGFDNKPDIDGKNISFQSFGLQLQEIVNEGKMAKPYGQEIKSIYELGCGSGANLYFYQNFFKDSIFVGGLDYSESLIETARSFVDSDDLCCKEAIELHQFRKYDIVMSAYVFKYFPSYEYAKEVLEKMFQKANRMISIISVCDLRKKEEFLDFRRRKYVDFEERYKDLTYLYIPKEFFIEFAETHRCDIKFKIIEMENYWNAEFSYNCYIYKN